MVTKPVRRGAGSAFALDLAGACSVNQTDVARPQARLADNLERADHDPALLND